MAGHHHAQAGHHHAHWCDGSDHHAGTYTAQQRADLDRVLAFNRQLATAIEECHDISSVEEYLDPDPLRYMWVDEGQGQIGPTLDTAEKILHTAPKLPGHTRSAATVVPGSVRAARPSIACRADGVSLCCWVEWLPDAGEVLRCSFLGPDLVPLSAQPRTLDDQVQDVFRPTAVFDAAGSAWVFYGKREARGVAVWATHTAGDGWSMPQRVSTTEHPSFNQEVAVHADGRLELCWQARNGNRFGIYSRVWDGGWGPTDLVTAGVETNVWDPAVAGYADGSTAYAWSEYDAGAYVVVTRVRNRSGQLGEPRRLTSGTDYALHPTLAVTADQQLWCGFDVVTVSGHGGSGPTALVPLAALEGAADPAERLSGMRAAGDSVPPELLPEVSASVRVVAVGASGVSEPAGELAAGLDVVPSGLPKLVATPDGGLVVAYRVHRKLPLMTYYWEVASQVLGPAGWQPPTTWSGTDGTLEEVSVAASPGGAVLAAQTDARLARALQWTEGFGGRECPYLLEHHGSVIWHGVHGVGAVATAAVEAGGAVPEQAAARPVVHSAGRMEARRWVVPGRSPDRYVTSVGDQAYTLFWGDLHRHSLVSRCTAGDEPSLDDFYRYAWDVCEYDFWAVTDHAENSSDYQWWAIQKIADLFHIPGVFVPLYGFEWTSAATGHQNVIYGDVARGAPIFSAFAAGSTDPDGLWESLRRHPAYPAITIPHHPGSAMVYNDWDYHDPRYSRLVEVFQACRGNYEQPGAFRQYADATREGTFTLDGLLRGHRFGLIASSDHGHGASYVGAYARGLNRADVFEALSERRTFASTTRGLLLDVSMGPAFLGEEVEWSGPREFRVHAEGYADLARVDVVRDGVTVHTVMPEEARPTGWLRIPLRLEWGGSDHNACWDGELSVLDGDVMQTPFWSPEVTAVTPSAIRWRHETRCFGEPYGSQRGGVEVTVMGPPEAAVTVRTTGAATTISLGELAGKLARGEGHEVPGTAGRFRLQGGVGGLTSLGTRTLDLTWTDHHLDPAFYYVRAYQVDGEMAWSSPIWVAPGKN